MLYKFISPSDPLNTLLCLHGSSSNADGAGPSDLRIESSFPYGPRELVSRIYQDSEAGRSGSGAVIACVLWGADGAEDDEEDGWGVMPRIVSQGISSQGGVRSVRDVMLLEEGCSYKSRTWRIRSTDGVKGTWVVTSDSIRLVSSHDKDGTGDVLKFRAYGKRKWNWRRKTVGAEGLMHGDMELEISDALEGKLDILIPSFLILEIARRRRWYPNDMIPPLLRRNTNPEYLDSCNSSCVSLPRPPSLSHAQFESEPDVPTQSSSSGSDGRSSSSVFLDKLKRPWIRRARAYTT